MKGLLKIFAFLILVAAIVCGIFFGRMFLMRNELQKDLEELESYDFEVLYHISGDSDVLDMEEYETDETPVIIKWLSSYVKKMEQGGCIDGEMRDGVYYANVYAEGEEQSSIEFFYKDQAVFGVKKTLDYIIASVANTTDLPISLLQNVTPNGYITLEQMKTVLGVSQEMERTMQMNLMEMGRELLTELNLVIPTSVKDNYFQTKLENVDMSYCLAKTSLNGEEMKVSVGISNETYHKYVYIRIDDVCGKQDSNLEVLLHINVTENETIEVPETISDGVVDTLASVVSVINTLAKK